MGGMNNKSREAHFTSSNAYKLIPMGERLMTSEELVIYKENNPGSRAKKTKCPLLFNQAGLTYIEEKQIELRMQSCLDGGGSTRVLAWGNFMELVIYNILGMHYQIASKDTVLHPKFGKFWSGSVDLFTESSLTNKKESVAEIKCYQKKNFALYCDVLLQKNVALFRDKFPKEYWQIVSNAIIHEVEIGEAIAYMPYLSESEEIQDMASNYEGSDSWQFRFIHESPVSELPFLPDGGYYKNICKFSFIVPEEDKEFLTQRMILAGAKLTEKTI